MSRSRKRSLPIQAPSREHTFQLLECEPLVKITRRALLVGLDAAHIMWLRRLDCFYELLQRGLEGEADRLLLPPFAAAAATRTTLSFLLSLFFALMGTEQLFHKGCASLTQQLCS